MLRHHCAGGVSGPDPTLHRPRHPPSHHKPGLGRGNNRTTSLQQGALRPSIMERALSPLHRPSDPTSSPDDPGRTAQLGGVFGNTAWPPARSPKTPAQRSIHRHPPQRCRWEGPSGGPGWGRKQHLVIAKSRAAPGDPCRPQARLTLHPELGPPAVLVDHDEEDHQQDAGEGGQPHGDGHLRGAKAGVGAGPVSRGGEALQGPTRGGPCSRSSSRGPGGTQLLSDASEEVIREARDHRGSQPPSGL